MRQALALPNPAALYCEKLGFEYQTVQTPAGARGVVVVEPGVRFDAWAFFKGQVGNEYAFGALYGCDTVCVRTNRGGCVLEYAVCVPRGEKSLPGAAGIPLLDFMAQKGVPLFEEPGAREKRAASGGKSLRAPEDDLTALYDVMAQGKTLPAAFDWRAHNGHAYIGAVRDQGSCGSCYAFGANAAAEGTYNWALGLDDGRCADFSEAFIIWSLGRLPEYSSHFFGCSGSDWDYAELTALVSEGVCSETDFPYTTADPGGSTHLGDPRTRFNAWHRVACGDVEAIKTAIITYGVVDAAVDVTADFHDYTSGIFSNTSTNCPPDPEIGPACYHAYTDHAISLVGWDDNPPEGGGGCWILRNSWGSSWGESGYMRIRYHAARVACEVCYLVYLGANTHTLAIASAHGGADPPAGVITNNHGAFMICGVTNSPVAEGTTQYAAAGWTGGGSVPASGSGTNTGLFALTNDSTLTWLWQTNLHLSLAASGPGRLDQVSGWQPRGSNVTVTATPNASAWLSGWSGDTSGCVISADRIVIPMSVARSITALFGSGSLEPPAWLAASQGGFSDQVWLMWGGVPGAAGYTVWRGLTDFSSSATLIGSSATESYSDTSAIPVQVYTYWVKGANAFAASAFSPPAWGWRASAAPHPVNGDYDGDDKADPAAMVNGRWFIKLSSDGYSLAHLSFGNSNSFAFARDFDGDRRADPAVYEAASGEWQIKLSGSGYATATMENFGGASDQPVAGDYDGDGKADPAVYNTSDGAWRVAMSSAGYAVQGVSGFGGAGYTAVAQNYDSDHRYDAAIYNQTNGNWTVLLSAQNYITATLWGFGGTGWTPVLGDFDGDGLNDPALYEETSGKWQVKMSDSGYATASLSGFGGSGFLSGAADYDGDGKADPTLLDLTTGVWRIKLSGSGYAEAALASGWTP